MTALTKPVIKQQTTQCTFLFGLLMAICSVISVNALASGVRLVSDEFLIKEFKHICVLEIESVNTQDKLQTFTDGTTRRVSSTVNMLAKPGESLKGDCGSQPFTTHYTTPITATFHDDGSINMRYTTLKTHTGLEMQVQVGKQYIVSFYDWQHSSPLQRHYRVNALNVKPSMVEVIARQNKPD